MDWKEGAKWIVVIVTAGAISTAIEMLVTGYVKTTAASAANASVQNYMSQSQMAMATQPRLQMPPRQMAAPTSASNTPVTQEEKAYPVWL